MSMTTPPGWYADPQAPGTERWWDGSAWTAHSRAAQAVVPTATPGAGAFGPHTVPLQHAAGGGGNGSGKRRTVAFAAAGAVLVAAVAVGAVLLGKDDEPADPRSGPTAASTTAPPATAGPDDTASPSATAAEDATQLVDQLNGITIPIPEGWEKSESIIGSGTTMYTDQTYDCPGGGSSICRHGQVTSMTAVPSGSAPATARAAAERDIEEAADKAYEQDALGTRIHGGITSHTVVKAQNFAVAGRSGYLVRWRVITGAGPGGYVQSLAFPSSVGTEALVVVRFAFDAGPDGPGLDEMDRIAAGIRPIGDATSGGVGSSIGPS